VFAEPEAALHEVIGRTVALLDDLVPVADNG